SAKRKPNPVRILVETEANLVRILMGSEPGSENGGSGERKPTCSGRKAGSGDNPRTRRRANQRKACPVRDCFAERHPLGTRHLLSSWSRSSAKSFKNSPDWATDLVICTAVIAEFGGISGTTCG